MVHWRIGALVHWCIDALAHWCIGPSKHWCGQGLGGMGGPIWFSREAWRAARELRRHTCSRKKWCVCVKTWARGVHCTGGASSGLDAALDADAADWTVSSAPHEAAAGVPADTPAHIHGPHMSSSWARASATPSCTSPLTSLRHVAAEEAARVACSDPGEARKRASLSCRSFDCSDSHGCSLSSSPSVVLPLECAWSGACDAPAMRRLAAPLTLLLAGWLLGARFREPDAAFWLV